MVVERRVHRPGGFFRSVVRLRRNRESEKLAEEELRTFYFGEPSQAIFPRPGKKEQVIFQSARRSKRKPEDERETTATAKDIQNRLMQQLERYVELEHYAGHPAQLPPGWIRFGVKYWDEIQEIKGNSITLSSSEPSLSI